MTARGGGAARIEKMREYEDKIARMTVASKEDKKLGQVAVFEARTDDRIRANVVTQRFEALKMRREGDLDGRRRRLADKLYGEDLDLKAELVTLQETPEQRRAKLAGRARHLAAVREAERAETATRLLDRHFEVNCDVLRSANSKRILYRTVEERNAQIEQRMATRILEEEEARMFNDMNETEKIKAEQRHLDDMQKRRDSRAAMVSVLDNQVKAVEERRREESLWRQQEVGELHALWAQIAKEQEEVEAAERDKMKRLAFELQEFNRIKQMELTEQERFERELDLKYLQEALAQEAADEANEQAARDKRRGDMLRYREQLAHMLVKDAEDNASRDSMIEQVWLEQQAKRDAELEAREEARRKLMAEVDQIRQRQIADRQARKERAYLELVAERERLEAEERLAQTADAKKALKVKRVALERKLELQTQIVARAHVRAAEEDEKLTAMQIASGSETAYLGKVQQALADTDPPKWYGRKKFDW